MQQQKLVRTTSLLYLLASVGFGIAAVLHGLSHRNGLVIIFGLLAVTFFSLGIMYRAKVNQP